MGDPDCRLGTRQRIAAGACIGGNPMGFLDRYPQSRVHNTTKLRAKPVSPSLNQTGLRSLYAYKYLDCAKLEFC